VATAIVLAVVVVFLFGDSGSGAGGDGLAAGGASGTPGGRGVSARAIATVSVRQGPGQDYDEMGTLRSGQTVEVIGRSADGSWLQIYFPTNSNLKGWVEAKALNLPASVATTLPIGTATAIARPTQAPAPTQPPQPTSTPEPPATPTATQGPSGPDIAAGVLNNNCTASSAFVVTVKNAGTEPLVSRQVQITVSTPSGVVGAPTTHVLDNLPPGAVANLPTGKIVQAPRTTATVDLLGSPPDIDTSDNVAVCVVQQQPATPAPTVPVQVPPPPPPPATPTRVPTTTP
jgi:uncharacterized protein YraI